MESFQTVYLVVRCVYNAWKAALDTGSGFGSLREPTLELNFTNPYCTFSRPNKTLFWKNMSSLMIIWKWLCSLGWVFFDRFLYENLLGLHLVIFNAYVEDIMQSFLSLMFAVSCWWSCWWSKFFILLLFFFFFFQYVTLFASAFPLAAAVSILFLFIEGRADLFKLLHMYQRPKVRR